MRRRNSAVDGREAIASVDVITGSLEVARKDIKRGAPGAADRAVSIALLGLAQLRARIVRPVRAIRRRR